MFVFCIWLFLPMYTRNFDRSVRAVCSHQARMKRGGHFPVLAKFEL
jgi:hypothetical protein